MGTAGWIKIDKFYLETERFGLSYGLNIYYSFSEIPEISQTFLHCLTVDQAKKLGRALLDWADIEEKSRREILKEIPK